MKYEEIKHILSNPDKIPDGLTELDSLMNTMNEELTSLRAEKEKTDARIKDLQETNMKLYLRLPGINDQQTEQEDKDDFELLLDKIKGD